MSKLTAKEWEENLGAKDTHGPWITLASGQPFYFENPGRYPISIEDIAHGLSHLCRYVGHCSQFYSVAEHSVYVSRILPPELAISGLLHDAAEAVLGDVASPLKKLLPDYRAMEERVEWEIMKQFGVPYPFPPEVKGADAAVTAAEVQQIMPFNWMKGWGVEAAPIRVEGWSPLGARGAFLERYRQLVD